MNRIKALIRPFKSLDNDRLFLELSLIAIVVALTYMMHLIDGYKLVILNLFYLPVVLSGFFLGRYHTGALTLLGVVSASVVAALHFDQLADAQSPLVIAMVFTVWACVLGLTALLVGTLSDDRLKKETELHEAYVGVVDVLSSYLQSANPRLKARSTRVAELSQAVSMHLRMSAQQTDNIRVAALMQDLGKIEVTTRILTKAVDSLEATPDELHESRFHGIDLVHSLGSVLKGAIPLLSHEDSTLGWCSEGISMTSANMPLGARVIRLSRAFDDLTEGGQHGHWSTPEKALQELRRIAPSPIDSPILNAIEAVSEKNLEMKILAMPEAAQSCSQNIR